MTYERCLQKDISADEPKKELVNSQNIPVTQTVPAADLNKTGTNLNLIF